MLKLRNWQEEAFKKAVHWFDQGKDKRFLINAAPGAGKTICASIIAKDLIEKKKIDTVIVVAPRTEVVSQWQEAFKAVTGRKMIKITGGYEDISDFDGSDLCSTWNAIQNAKDLFEQI